jgi:putative protease
VWDLPFVIFDQEWSTFQKAVSHLVHAGFNQFRLSNLSHFELFKKYPEVRLEASYRLFCLNSEAMQAWQELGVVNNELYIEDDCDNMKQLLLRRGSHTLSAMVYGSVPLITSRIRIPGLKGGQPLLSDRGDGYQVVSRAGLTVLRSENDFSLCSVLPQLYDMGCSGFLVDISHLGVFTPQGKKVLESYRQRRDLPHTSPFNFNAGME